MEANIVVKRNRIVLTDDKGKKVKISKQNFNYLMKKYSEYRIIKEDIRGKKNN